MSRSILLVGGTGVLGRRALVALVDAGHQVTANVRNAEARSVVREHGASPITFDVFDAAAARRAAEGHDTVINLATSVPTGARGSWTRAWRANDRLRTIGANNLAAAVCDGGTYIGESIVMSYADAGDRWVDEHAVRPYGVFDRAVADAEAAAESARDRGVTAITLRFAIFWASDSAHIRDIIRFGRRGLWALPGDADGYISFMHPDDGAQALVAALGAPSGVYNVAEPNPRRRWEHAQALASALDKRRLRSMPAWIQRRAGEPLRFLTRSLRISSNHLTAATGWEPKVDIIHHWAEVTD